MSPLEVNTGKTRTSAASKIKTVAFEVEMCRAVQIDQWWVATVEDEYSHAAVLCSQNSSTTMAQFWFFGDRVWSSRLGIRGHSSGVFRGGAFTGWEVALKFTGVTVGRDGTGCELPLSLVTSTMSIFVLRKTRDGGWEEEQRLAMTVEVFEVALELMLEVWWWRQRRGGVTSQIFTLRDRILIWENYY